MVVGPIRKHALEQLTKEEKYFRNTLAHVRFFLDVTKHILGQTKILVDLINTHDQDLQKIQDRLNHMDNWPDKLEEEIRKIQQLVGEEYEKTSATFPKEFMNNIIMVNEFFVYLLDGTGKGKDHCAEVGSCLPITKFESTVKQLIAKPDLDLSIAVYEYLEELIKVFDCIKFHINISQRILKKEERILCINIANEHITQTYEKYTELLNNALKPQKIKAVTKLITEDKKLLVGVFHYEKIQIVRLKIKFHSIEHNYVYSSTLYIRYEYHHDKFNFTYKSVELNEKGLNIFFKKLISFIKSCDRESGIEFILNIFFKTYKKIK